ncbi:hypothetical protein Thiosp_00964 [Thiorhodovibrio litoralis]|nr:hypothetical protein Thiosp_00964 [Thiorhodovibrio litoralis]
MENAEHQAIRRLTWRLAPFLVSGALLTASLGRLTSEPS